MVETDINRYFQAHVARTLSQSKESAEYYGGALEKFVKDFTAPAREKGSSKLEKDLADGFEKTALTSQESKIAIMKVYGEKYQESLNELTFDQFYAINEARLISYVPKEKMPKTKELFEKYKGKTLGEVRKKFAEAVWKLDDPGNTISKEDKEKAKETKESLKQIYVMIELIENAKYEEARPEAVKIGMSRKFEELLK